MDKLKAINLFVSVCQMGSFSRAAQANSCSPSTVSKAIERLEKELGSMLFIRSTRNLTLTHSGEAYLNATQSMLEALGECESEIREHHENPAGLLKVNIPVPFGRLYFQPMLKAFCKQYPNIELDIRYTDQYLDMIEHGIDITIRAGQVNDNQLVGRQLSPLYLIICASPCYISKNGSPSDANEFSNHHWIRLKFQQSGKVLPILMPDNNEVRKLNPNRKIIVDNAESLAELCVDGLGLAQLPHFSARVHLQNGKLIPLFHSLKSDDYAVNLLYAKQKRTPAKIKSLINFLQQHLAAMGETPYNSWAADINPTTHK